jgi:hypothetical protein
MRTLRLIPPLNPWSIKILLPRIIRSVAPFPLTQLDRNVLTWLWMQSGTGAPVVSTVGCMAEAAGVTVRSVRRAVARLEGYQLVEREYQVMGPAMNGPSRYLLHVPASVALDGILPETRMNPPRTQQTAMIGSSGSGLSTPAPGSEALRRRSTAEQSRLSKGTTMKTELFPVESTLESGKSPVDPVIAARDRLATDDHWRQRLTRTVLTKADPILQRKALASTLLAYWVDKRTVAEPGLRPPRTTSIQAGQAGHIVNRWLVPGADPVEAWFKAKRITDCAFARECWPFKGNTDPVELASLAHRGVFDRIRAHLGERINGPVRKRTLDEQLADLRAQAAAERARYAS